MKRRYLSIVLALGVAMSLFVGAIATSGANTDSDGELLDGDQSPGVYLPWVPDGHMLDGQGPFYGSVTVQNTNDDTTVDLYFFPGDPEGWGDPYVVNDVQPWASTTASATDLFDDVDLDEDGGSVRVHAVDSSLPVTFDTDEGAFVWTAPYDTDDNSTDDVAADDPAENLEFLEIAGSVKNVSPQAAVGTANTNTNHITVDGYSGMTMNQIDSDPGEHVLPIVQSNSGWDTQIKIANFGSDGNVNYNITLYETGSGTGSPFKSESGTIEAGEVEIWDLSDFGIGAGWTGSMYISANDPIGAVAERYKNDEDMLVTNASRPTVPGGERAPWMKNSVAPLVFQDYNFWNTGISVANLDESTWNDVQIDFYTPGGSLVGSEAFRIDPRGQKFLFVPGNQNLGLGGQVGAAIVRGTTDLHAAVDQVKYLGDDEETGDAMSYVTISSMEKANSPFSSGDMLSVPLVQKGNPNTGTGDTSGVQYFNSNGSDEVFFEVAFVSTTGNASEPTTNTPLQFRLSSHQGATVYTHNYSSMSQGFVGSVISEVTDGQGWLSAVSNNVNYEVQGDGAVAYQAVLIDGSMDGLFPEYRQLGYTTGN